MRWVDTAAKTSFALKTHNWLRFANEPLSFLMTNSHFRGPISVTTSVNIRHTVKYRIQHIIWSGEDFEGKFQEMKEDPGGARERKEAREKF